MPLVIVFVILNVNICCNWSSQCLENVWTTLIYFVMYVENLQWKLKDSPTSRIEKAYELYFGCKVGNEDQPWVPHVCWVTCASNRKWLQGSRQSLPFAFWRQQNDHIREYYFCVNNVKGFSAKYKHGVQYPKLPSAIHQGLMTFSTFQSSQGRGQLMMKARGASQTTGMKLQSL